jgi:hypothetical protein
MDVIAVVTNVLFGLLQWLEKDAPRTFPFRLTLTDFSCMVRSSSRNLEEETPLDSQLSSPFNRGVYCAAPLYISRK